MPFSRIKGVGGGGAIPAVMMVLMGRDGAGRPGRGGGGGTALHLAVGVLEKVLELMSNLHVHVP